MMTLFFLTGLPERIKTDIMPVEWVTHVDMLCCILCKIWVKAKGVARGVLWFCVHALFGNLINNGSCYGLAYSSTKNTTLLSSRYSWIFIWSGMDLHATLERLRFRIEKREITRSVDHPYEYLNLNSASSVPLRLRASNAHLNALMALCWPLAKIEHLIIHSYHTWFGILITSLYI